MDISTNQIKTFPSVAYHARTSLDAGASGGGYGCIIHLAGNASIQDQATAQSILDLSGSLEVTTSKAQIAPDLIDEVVVSCPTLGLTFDYILYRSGEAVLTGTVSDGTLEFSTDVTGNVTIEIKDPASFATGFVTIEVT